jgi:signal transduction histidine kinase
MKRLRRLTLAEQVTFAFAVGVVYLAAVGAVAYTSVVRLGDATERATRTHIVLRLLDETLALVAGAETGSRGFVITGDTQYLEPYRNAEIDAAKRLKSLETSIDDRVQQRERLRRLVPLVARRFALLDEAVRLRANKGLDDAVSAARTGRGRMVMDSIRALVDSMSADETTRLRDRSAQERRSLRRAAALIGLSFFAAVTLGLAAALFVSRDIGRRLRAEEEARHAKEVAEAASRAKSEFLAMMSHELRTPLNSVIGFSNVLLRNRTGNLRERDLLYLQRIRAGGQHLLSLINEVLDLSKIEAGRMQVEQAPVSLGALIEDTIASFEGQLRGRPIELVAEMPRHMTPIVTDPAKLLQVLTNLIGNAIKFTERGTVTVRVVADVASGRPERIDVADTGIGIPADRQQAIFDAFEQADSSTARQFGGTGLGLAVSKSLCDLLGYTLEVRSEIGVGSMFSVMLTPSPGPGRGDWPLPADRAVPAEASPSGH